MFFNAIYMGIHLRVYDYIYSVPKIYIHGYIYLCSRDTHTVSTMYTWVNIFVYIHMYTHLLYMYIYIYICIHTHLDVCIKMYFYTLCMYWRAG